ncbi:putative carboxypeptidase S1 [Dothidotthia symphoricarpi CBS 119687]|uniref:Putative carboxypeptidase S1 n=1 Tax=Dothidotthia symphoricarpi CBS 119687 TaxID=1392245 RepID=A0A6A6AV20_9PLEO|nr:putative carboxypeptidase S1 [Dothidotthia symphoricarpi CBS 119687]KAF2134717.1 putative carboxypeptidase S1 [Dothidotthia symphoricarpi CBS 119687]
MHLLSLFMFAGTIAACCSQKTYSRPGKQRVVKHSKRIPGASIEYQKTSLCDNPGGSYSGYVYLPSSAIPDLESATPFNISTFFWFFPRRNSAGSDKMAVYLAGGPGESSTWHAFVGTGPCRLMNGGREAGRNDISFNNQVSMLYIDQPNHVGYSYDTIVDGYYNVLDETVHTGPGTEGVMSNLTIMRGRFSSQNPATTASTTEQVSKHLWQFLQVWFAEYVDFGPYGGAWAPAVARYILSRNSNLDRSRHSKLHLESVGMINSCNDIAIMGQSYLDFAINNTYSQPFINQTTYDIALNELNKSGGCIEQIQACRDAAVVGDPKGTGANLDVNGICLQAFSFCGTNVQNTYIASGHSVFDIAATPNYPFPPKDAVTFLNQKWVREQLGVPEMNFTWDSQLVRNQFFQTGDALRRTIQEVQDVLEQGVKVAMIYGDRDFQCNWFGGEKLALSLNAPKTISSLEDAGYTTVKQRCPASQSSSCHSHNPLDNTKAAVRQHSSLSFSRVFDAAHYAEYHQPESITRIFERTIMSSDVETGEKLDAGEVDSKYVTKGYKNGMSIRNQYERVTERQCSLWSVQLSCSPTQINALVIGTARVKNMVVVHPPF